MKTFMKPLLVAAVAVMSVACQKSDPLPSWNNTSVKESIISFVTKDAPGIPKEDRIAVFDMDGTIACEAPLWFEMYVAVEGMNEKLAKDSSLIRFPEYSYAKKLAANPFDTSVTNNWASAQGNYIDTIVWKAFEGADHEAYVEKARQYLSSTKDPKYGIPLAKMFYQPMLELIQYLRHNDFTVYIVSGSVQGVVWSVCPDVLGIPRANLLGTKQIVSPAYDNAKKYTTFTIGKGIFTPKNNSSGKAQNIYAQIGKIPVFAFGNTTGDFDMMHLVTANKHPHAAYLLNHDDAEREYAYPPYHGKAVEGWQDTLKVNGWRLVNMKEEFKTVWMK